MLSDVPKRPSSEHRYTRVSEHGAVPHGQRARNHHKVHATIVTSPVKTSRTRIVQSGRKIMANSTGPESSRSRASQPMTQRESKPTANTDVSETSRPKRRNSLIKRFLERNSAHIEAIDPILKNKSVQEQVDALQTALSSEYGGDFVRFFNDLQADERDLRLRTSHQVASTIGPQPTYAPPPSCHMDGYQTARKKHDAQIRRVLGSAREPTVDAEAPRYNRTKGTIADYGNFSEWSKYKQLNATAMLNR